MRQPHRILVLVVTCLFLVASPLHVFGQGKILADTGFRPEQNGFSFENYTNDSKPTNLTPEAVHQLFGDRACKTITNGNCILSASAEAWMNSTNNEMGGGHCEGMAALSSLIFSGKVKLADLDPNAKSVSDLNPNDPKVQAEIAKWWATQTVDPTAAAEIKKTPNDIVDLLIQNMKPGSSPFTMGITQSDGEGGHAITPYSVIDMGNGQVRIMVYDNNYPGKERWIDVDRNANTWKYTGSTNPAEQETAYSGDASSLSLTLTPADARLTVPQKCDFCEQTAGGDTQPQATEAATEASPSQSACDYTYVTTRGDTETVVGTPSGKFVKVAKGQVTSTIEGAEVIQLHDAANPDQTIGDEIAIPKSAAEGGNFIVSVKGNAAGAGSEIDLESCGDYFSANGLSQPADIEFAPNLSTVEAQIEPGENVAFSGSYDSPNGNDHSFEVNQEQFTGASDVIRFVNDPATGQLKIDSQDATGFQLQVETLAPDGTIKKTLRSAGNQNGPDQSEVVNLDQAAQDQNAGVTQSASNDQQFVQQFTADESQVQQEAGQ